MQFVQRRKGRLTFPEQYSCPLLQSNSHSTSAGIEISLPRCNSCLSELPSHLVNTLRAPTATSPARRQNPTRALQDEAPEGKERGSPPVLDSIALSASHQVVLCWSDARSSCDVKWTLSRCPRALLVDGDERGRRSSSTLSVSKSMIYDLGKFEPGREEGAAGDPAACRSARRTGRIGGLLLPPSASRESCVSISFGESRG